MTTHTFKSLPAIFGNKKSINLPKGGKIIVSGKKRSSTTSQVKSIIRSSNKAKEKRFDNNGALATNVLATSFAFVNLTDIAQGIVLNTRLQDEITINYVHIALSLHNNSSLKAKFIRIMLVKERSSRGIVLDTTNWTNLFEGTDFLNRTADALSGDISSPLNRDVLDIIFDKVVVIKPELIGAMYIKRKIRVNRKVKYNTISGEADNPNTGRLYYIVHVMEGDNASSSVIINLESMARVFFKDS